MKDFVGRGYLFCYENNLTDLKFGAVGDFEDLIRLEY